MHEPKVEELASLCLQRMQDEGQQVVEEICAQHPECATELRGMVAQLLKLGLMDEPRGQEIERLGEYKILHRLGGGGMGVVYLALQENLGRQVALKIMHPGFGLREKSKARFRREIEAISAIDHPGVCTVYEAGEAKGVPYLAMRYIEGQTLAQILDQRRTQKNAQQKAQKKSKPTSSGGSQELNQLLECVEKVAEALHCAHEVGLVHRDVKPGNIMIDSQGDPVILDFGLVQDAGVDSHDLTASGDLLGTPAYMSPEQVEGKVVDRRSDIYSLAVTLYECLTLGTPFRGPNRQLIYSKILTDPPPDPRKTTRHIGKDLWIVLSKALEKDPRLRFSSALEFAEELRRIRSHQPIQSLRPGLPVRALRWTQRNQAATAVLVTMAVACLFSLWFLRKSYIAEDRLRALTLLGEAMNLKDRDTTLSFKLAREAWKIDSDNPDPRLLCRIQEILPGLRSHKVLARGKTPYDRVMFSSQGRFILIMGRDQQAILCTGEGDRIEVDLPMARTRAFPGAFSPDETELAIADREGRIFRFDLTSTPPQKIWQSRKPVHPFVWMVAYHDWKKSRRLLVCSTNEADNDNQATVWKLGEETPVDIHSRGGMRWKSGAWLPNGRFVAAGALWEADGAKVLDLDPNRRRASGVAVDATVDKGSPEVTLDTGFEAYVRRVVVSPKHFLTITQTGVLRVYEHDGQPIGTQAFGVTKEMEKVTEAFFGREGKSILVTFQNGRVRLLDVATWTLSTEDFEFHPHRTVFAAAFSGPEGKITIGNWAGRIGTWSADGTPRGDFLAHSNGITALAYSPDERRLLSASFGGVVKLWDLQSRAGQRGFRGIPWPHMAVSPDGRQIAIMDRQGRLILSDEDGKKLPLAGGVFQSLYKGVTVVGFSPDGQKLLIHALGRPVQVLDLLGRAPPLKGPESNYDTVARYLDRETVLTTRMDARQDLILWQPKRGTQRVLYRLPEDQVYDRPVLTSSDVSENGQEIVIGDRRGWIFVIDREGKRLWKSPSQVGLVRDVCFSKDARYVLAATEDGRGYVWDRQSSEVKSYGPQSSGVIKAIFSPDERQVVLGYKSGRIRIWNRESGKQLLEFAGHKGQQIHSLAYTHSGWLVSAGADGTIRWWWTQVQGLTEAIESIPIHDLTPAERAQFPDLFSK